MLFPRLHTCTIVPVGLTKHREGLMKIPPVTKEYAIDLLQQLPELRKQFSGDQSPFVLCSDEWYILGNAEFPSVQEYGNVDLVENGVGQVQTFLNHFHAESATFHTSLQNPKKVTMVTGTLVYDIMNSKVVPILNQIQNFHIELIPIKNNFYGESVTVSGLLTGQDIVKQLKGKDLGDEIWASHRILNHEGVCTLDDMTLDSMSKELNCPVKVGVNNAKLVEEVKKIAETVKSVVGEDVKLITTYSDDNRSYHISSNKIKTELGFEAKHTIRDAVEDLCTAFEKNLLPNSLDDQMYFNIKRMQNLELV